MSDDEFRERFGTFERFRLRKYGYPDLIIRENGDGYELRIGVDDRTGDEIWRPLTELTNEQIEMNIAIYEVKD